MKKFEKYLSVKNILIVIFLTIKVLFLCLILLIYLFSREKNYFEILSKKIEIYEKNVILLEVNEKKFSFFEKKSSFFFKKGESEYIKNFENIFLEIKILGENIEINLLSKKEKELFNNIKKDLFDYKKQFEQLTIEIKERGFKDFGIISSVEKYRTKTFEKIIKSDVNQKIKNLVNDLEILERDYFLNKKIIYKEKIINKINLLSKTISMLSDSIENKISPIESLILTDGLENYRISFNSLIEKDKKIGFIAGDDNLLKNIDFTRKKIFENINDFLEKIEIKKNNVSQSFLFKSILTIIIFIIISVFLYIKVYFSSTTFIEDISKKISFLEKGNLIEKIKHVKEKDLNNLFNSFNGLNSNLKSVKIFVEEIGKGNLEAKVNIFDNKGDIGSALIKMRNELKILSDERKKQKNDENLRNWITEGISKFNDILRKTNNLEKFGNEIIRNLVFYLEANQGGILIHNKINENEEFLELIASYAYDRKKFIKKKILIGEGLVGTCALEKKTVYMKNIPENYIEITSSLGSSSPKNLLIVPLKLENEVLGIVEIASFKNFENFQISFLEKVSENIASTLKSLKVNTQTKELLRQAQMQTEELASKEEEMRQNMEELKATQEEASRKEVISDEFVNAVNITTMHANIDLNGKFKNANEKFLKKIGENLDDIKSNYFNEILINSEIKKLFSKKWDKMLKNLRYFSEEFLLKTKINDIWIHGTFIPVLNEENKINKIIFLAYDISERKNKEMKVLKITEKIKENEKILKDNLKISKENEEIMKKQEEEMKQNLEEMKITQENLLEKQNETDKLNKRMKKREEVLKKAFENNRKEKNKFFEKIKSKDKEIEELKKELKK